MQRKLILIGGLLSLTLVLSGCFNFSGKQDKKTSPVTNQISSTQIKQYQSAVFDLDYPKNWELITPQNFTSDIPVQTQLVIRNNLKNEIFTANVNIVKNNVPDKITTLDYAKEVLNRERTGMLNFQETKRELTKINIAGTDTETYTAEFTARLTQSDPLIHFIQTFGIKGTSGYIILGSYSLQENTTVVNKIKNIIKSFKLN